MHRSLRTRLQNALELGIYPDAEMRAFATPYLGASMRRLTNFLPPPIIIPSSRNRFPSSFASLFHSFFSSLRGSKLSKITGFRLARATRSRGGGGWHKLPPIVRHDVAQGECLLLPTSGRLFESPESEKMLLRKCTSASFSHRHRVYASYSSSCRGLLLDGALFPSSLRPGLRLGVISQSGRTTFNQSSGAATLAPSCDAPLFAPAFLWYRICKR